MNYLSFLVKDSLEMTVVSRIIKGLMVDFITSKNLENTFSKFEEGEFYFVWCRYLLCLHKIY